jgi:DNA-directed RNA polymerase specialized sigma24 family protein
MTPERWGRIKDLFLRDFSSRRSSSKRNVRAAGHTRRVAPLRATASPADTAWQMLGSGAPAADDPRSAASLAVQKAIGQLRALDGLLYEIVVLHYFTGADAESIAAQLHVDETTVESELIVFKAWLSLALGR